MLGVKEIMTTSLILFSVIDIIGTLPVILDMQRKGMQIKAGLAALVSGVLMVSFLFFGASILSLFGLEVSSFALAGSLIILFIGLEMTLGIRLFRDFEKQNSSGNIVPLVFPLLAGAGTLTTIISLRSEYQLLEIIIAILVNATIIFFVLRSTRWLDSRISEQMANTLRKIFGILLIAIAFQMFKSNIL